MSLPSAKKLLLNQAVQGIPIDRATVGPVLYLTEQLPSGLDKTLVDLFFRPDGKRLFITTQGLNIYEFDVPAAFDLTTVTYTNRVLSNISGNSFDMRSTFSADGLALFQASYLTGSDDYTRLYARALAQPWTLTQTSLASRSFPRAAPGGAYRLKDAAFSPSGLQMWLLYGLNDSILVHFNLSSPWNINTAVASGKTFTFEGSIEKLSLSGDGKGLLATDSRRYIRSYLFKTAYDIATLTYAKKFRDVSPDGPYLYSVFLRADAKQAFAGINILTPGGASNPENRIITLDMR